MCYCTSVNIGCGYWRSHVLVIGDGKLGYRSFPVNNLDVRDFYTAESLQ